MCWHGPGFPPTIKVMYVSVNAHVNGPNHWHWQKEPGAVTYRRYNLLVLRNDSKEGLVGMKANPNLKLLSIRLELKFI